MVHPIKLPYWDAMDIADEAAGQRDFPRPEPAPGYKSIVAGGEQR